MKSVAKQSGVRGTNLRTLIILVTMGVGRLRVLGVLRRYGLACRMAVVVRACQCRATGLGEPYNPEQKPAEQQDTCCPGAPRVPPRSLLYESDPGYSLVCHGVNIKLPALGGI